MVLAYGEWYRELANWGVVLSLLIAGFWVVIYFARRYRNRLWSRKNSSSGQLTIEKLEKMRRDGLISQEEFSALRKAALGLGPAAGRSARPGLTQAAPDVDESKTREETEGPPSAEPPRA